MLTDTQRARAVERYLAGEGTSAIAVSFGVSRQAIAALLRRRGVKLRTQAKLTPSQRDEAVERYTQGQSSANIAASFGVTGVTILAVLHRRAVAVRECRLIVAFGEFLINDGTTGAKLSVRTHKSIYCVGTTGRSATRIIDLLYRDAETSLSRKAATAQEILHQEAEHE